MDQTMEMYFIECLKANARGCPADLWRKREMSVYRLG